MEGNDIKSFKNLCRIFEMRIKLDREKGLTTPETVLSNYEKYARKIDDINNSEFQSQIRDLLSPSATIEEEKERLSKVIVLLEDRLQKREELEDKYYETTGSNIELLQSIVSDAELRDKKERLNTINKYLDTTSEIETVTQTIDELKMALDEEEEKKTSYLEKNKVLEEELYTSFKNAIRNNEDFHDFSEEEVDKELVKSIDMSKEYKETLEVTKDSINSLIQNGLDEDYSSYAEEAEKSYYSWKDRELILKIYDSVIEKEDSFNELIRKRKKIQENFEERKILRKAFNVNMIDELLDFESLVFEQMNSLATEKAILENVNSYTSRIKFKEEKLKELNEIVSSVEILGLLREFGLTDTYDAKEEISFVNGDIEEKNIENEIVKEFLNPYRIKEVKPCPPTFNIGLAKLKAVSIRDKVNRKLNPNLQENTSEEVKDHPTENKIEVNDVPNQISEEKPILKPIVPVWEIPTDTKIEEVLENNVNVIELPTLNPNIPVSVKEPVKDAQIPDSNTTISVNEPAKVTQNNPFWVPVSDSKLPVDQFPNINIPVQTNNINKQDDFGFPSIGNNG